MAKCCQLSVVSSVVSPPLGFLSRPPFGSSYTRSCLPLNCSRKLTLLYVFISLGNKLLFLAFSSASSESVCHVYTHSLLVVPWLQDNGSQSDKGSRNNRVSLTQSTTAEDGKPLIFSLLLNRMAPNFPRIITLASIRPRGRPTATLESTEGGNKLPISLDPFW